MHTLPDSGAPALALRPEEAARRVGVAKKTLLDWVREGVIPAECVLRLGANGRTIRLHAERLRRWLDETADGLPAASVRPKRRGRPVAALRTVAGR